MTLAVGPVLAIGFDAWVRQATSFVGFLTACTGLVMGVCGVIWWIKKLRRANALNRISLPPTHS